jgi:hypothetical protein
MKRRGAATEITPEATADRTGAEATHPTMGPHSTALGQRIARPHTHEEAEAAYVAARDTWTAAMRAANSGRPADLASLAIAQEAYEAAVAERERWEAGGRVAIPVEPENEVNSLDAAVEQELAWRKVLHPEPKTGLLGRIRRRLTGR